MILKKENFLLLQKHPAVAVTFRVSPLNAKI